jgi:hypothetical protein
MNELHFIFQVVMSDRILLKIAKSVGNFKNEPNLNTNHASADEGMIPPKYCNRYGQNKLAEKFILYSRWGVTIYWTMLSKSTDIL